MILLTDEEKDKLYHTHHNIDILIDDVAEAQLKKVVDWLGEYDYGDAPTAMQVVNWIKQALLKDIE